MNILRGSCVRRAAPRGRAGFTLLEVLFATGILLVALSAAVSGQLVSLGLVRTARESNTAIAELSAAMESVLAQPLDSIPSAAGFPEGAPIAAFTDRALRDQRIVPDYPNHAGGAAPDVLQVVLTLSYTDWAGRPAQLRLASMKAR